MTDSVRVAFDLWGGDFSADAQGALAIAMVGLIALAFLYAFSRGVAHYRHHHAPSIQIAARKRVAKRRDKRRRTKPTRPNTKSLASPSLPPASELPGAPDRAKHAA